MAIAAELAVASRSAETMSPTALDEATARLVAVVESLPAVNQIILQHICAHLRKIDAVSSKMTTENLAICWAPCLFRCADISLALANAKKEIGITGLLIGKLPLPEDRFQADWCNFRSLVAARRDL